MTPWLLRARLVYSDMVIRKVSFAFEMLKGMCWYVSRSRTTSFRYGFIGLLFATEMICAFSQIHDEGYGLIGTDCDTQIEWIARINAHIRAWGER
jgi:hypothetical protein